MEKILITVLLSLLPLTNISDLHEGDPFTTYIQEKLIDLGFLDTTTGVNDKNTQRAIKTFQEKAGLVVDGMVGDNTFSKLLLGENAYQSTPNTTLPPTPTTTIPSSLDTESPVWDIDSPPYPSEIGTLFKLNIPSVTDNVGIVSYEVYVNDALSTHVTISDTQLFVTPKYDMTCADQLIYVKALDAAGNSSQSPTFTIPKSDPCISVTSSSSSSSEGGGGQSRLGGSSTGFIVTFGDTGKTSDASGVAIDSSDNIYITGTSVGANIFGASVTSGTVRNIYVVKLNSSGVVQWVYAAGGTGLDRGRKIALDSSGNVYVAGYYSSTVDFGGGDVTSNGNYDAFLLKLNSSGTFQWVKSYGANSGNDLGRDVAIDSSDNIYMLGAFRGTVNFGGGDEASNGNADVFLVKLNSSGVFQWVYTAGGTGEDGVRALALDSGDNPYITGHFSSTVNFGGGNTTAANSHDLFILKLNSSGAYQNIYTSNIDTTTKAKGLFIDSSGNIYATGTFQNTVNFGSGNITSDGKDIYLLKLNSSFAFQWARTSVGGDTGAGTALGMAVTVDEDGNVYSVGQVGGRANFGGVLYIFGTPTRAYIVKHDSSGTFQWFKYFGTGGYDANDMAQDIVIDSNGFVIIVGSTHSTVDFSTFGGDTLELAGIHSIILKIKSTGVID